MFSFLQPFLSNKKEIGVWFYQKFNVLIWTMQKNCLLSFIFKCRKNFIKSLNRELFELLKSSSVVCFRRFINVAVKMFRLCQVLQFFFYLDFLSWTFMIHRTAGERGAISLTIFTGKNLCFTEFSTKIHWNTKLAASDFFHMFTQSIKFFKFHYCTDVWKTWFIK